MAVGAHEQRRLALGVARADHLVHARDRRRVAARAGEQPVAGEDLVDRAGELGVRRRERITRWSQTRSRSATMCDESRTVMPVSTTASITALRNSRRASGSSEATGSSSSSSSGRLASASVSATCACWPPESLPTFCVERQVQALDPLARERVVPARVELAPEPERLADREAAVQRVVLRDEADAREHARRPRRCGERPSTRDARRRSASAGRRRAGAASSCRRRWGRRARSPSPPGPRACSRAAPTCEP